MSLIMEKLPKTTLAAVALSIMVMNLDKILKSILLCLCFIMLKTLNFIKYKKNRIYISKL